MSRSEFKQYLIENAGWSEDSAEREAASIYDNPEVGDSQDCDADSVSY